MSIRVLGKGGIWQGLLNLSDCCLRTQAEQMLSVLPSFRFINFERKLFLFFIFTYFRIKENGLVRIENCQACFLTLRIRYVDHLIKYVRLSRLVSQLL